MRAVLARAKELRITSPNGTDLRIGIAGRPVHVSDGIISPEDERRGDPATSVWLPAGEVYLSPQPGTAEGVLVGDADFFQGEPLGGLRLEIKGGKIAKMTAEAGLPVLEEQYGAAGAGRDLVSVVDIGINPGLRIPEGMPIHAWSRAGLVTVVIGNDLWAGGNNATTFGVSPYLARATVTIDGTPLVRDGRLVEKGLTAGR
jgi:aminopeptidase